MADQVTDSMQALDLTTKGSAAPEVDGAPGTDDFVDPWNVVSNSEKELTMISLSVSKCNVVYFDIRNVEINLILMLLHRKIW